MVLADLNRLRLCQGEHIHPQLRIVEIFLRISDLIYQGSMALNVDSSVQVHQNSCGTVCSVLCGDDVANAFMFSAAELVLTPSSWGFFPASSFGEQRLMLNLTLSSRYQVSMDSLVSLSSRLLWQRPDALMAILASVPITSV